MVDVMTRHEAMDYLASAPNALRAHFLDLGVGREGGRWALRHLEDVSEKVTGVRVSDTTWRDAIVLVDPGGKRKGFKPATLAAMAKTLRRLDDTQAGPRTDVILITTLSYADSGISPVSGVKASVDPADLAIDVIEDGALAPEDTLRFADRLLAAQPPDARREHVMTQLGRLPRDQQYAVMRHLMDLIAGNGRSTES